MNRWLELAGLPLQEDATGGVKIGLPNQMSEDEIWDVVRDNGIVDVESFKIDGVNVTFRLSGDVSSEQSDQFIDFVLGNVGGAEDEFASDEFAGDVEVDTEFDIEPAIEPSMDDEFPGTDDYDIPAADEVQPYDFDELSGKLGESVDTARLKKTLRV